MSERVDSSEISGMFEDKLTKNDAVVTIWIKVNDSEVSSEVSLHETMSLADDSDTLKALYFTALGSMIGTALELYPLEHVLGYIKQFVATEVEGKGQQRH